jgi:benzoyl-CoA reductase subunit C
LRIRERHRYDRKFEEWYENRHEYQRDWKKRTGKQRPVFFYTYELEEIFYAFDILPATVLGSHEITRNARPR